MYKLKKTGISAILRGGILAAGLFLVLPLMGSGKAVFDASCKFCHGAQGYGDGLFEFVFVKKPKELIPGKHNVKDFKRILSQKNKVRSTVRHFTSKVSSDSQLQAIADYILKGSNITGKILYKNSCQACHGQTANGEGIIVGFKKDPANLKAMSAEDLVAKTKSSRSKQLYLNRSINHIRRVPTQDQLEALVEYINSLDD